MSSAPIRFTGPAANKKITPEQEANMKLLKRIQELKGDPNLFKGFTRPVGK